MSASANDNGVRMADVVVVGGGLAGQLAVIAMADRAPHLLAASWDEDNRFARRLNYLAYRLLPGRWLRSFVFSAVYRLTPPTLARFYAGRTSTRDRLALLGAPLRLAYPKAKTWRRSLLGACS
jgi:hypothetical protein